MPWNDTYELRVVYAGLTEWARGNRDTDRTRELDTRNCIGFHRPKHQNTKTRSTDVTFEPKVTFQPTTNHVMPWPSTNLCTCKSRGRDLAVEIRKREHVREHSACERGVSNLVPTFSFRGHVSGTQIFRWTALTGCMDTCASYCKCNV